MPSFSTSSSFYPTDDDIVVTGMSAWTYYGRGLDALLQTIVSGRRELSAVETTRVDTSDPWYDAKQARQIAAQPQILLADGGPARQVSRDEWPIAMAEESAWDAVCAANKPYLSYLPKRIAITNGTSHGSNHGLIEYLAQSLEGRGDPELIADASALVARRIALRCRAQGPCYTINTACSSGINAIGQGMSLLRLGRADCVIAGAHDTFSDLSLTGFSSLKALDPNGCRPFDAQRAGLTLGDGAAYLVLERRAQANKRGATILATLTGYGYVGEAHHATAPHPEGAGVLRGMQAALAQDPAAHEINFVAAHGTGTPANDGAEAKAIQSLALAQSPINTIEVVSMKSQFGHCLGAAGSLQVVATIACMQAGWIPGNIGLQTPIEHDASIAFPLAPRPGQIRLAVCNALGFGGSMAAVCVRPSGLAATSSTSLNSPV